MTLMLTDAELAAAVKVLRSRYPETSDAAMRAAVMDWLKTEVGMMLADLDYHAAYTGDFDIALKRVQRQITEANS